MESEKEDRATLTQTERGELREGKLRVEESDAESKAGAEMEENKDERRAVKCWKSVRGFVLLSLVYRKFF